VIVWCCQISVARNQELWLVSFSFPLDGFAVGLCVSAKQTEDLKRK